MADSNARLDVSMFLKCQEHPLERCLPRFWISYLLRLALMSKILQDSRLYHVRFASTQPMIRTGRRNSNFQPTLRSRHRVQLRVTVNCISLLLRVGCRLTTHNNLIESLTAQSATFSTLVLGIAYSRETCTCLLERCMRPVFAC